MEKLIRPFIVSILGVISSIHDENMHFNGLIDINDIYLNGNETENKKEYTIKMLHPFLSDIITLLKLYSQTPKYFPSFFSPEVYNMFRDKVDTLKQLNFYNSF